MTSFIKQAAQTQGIWSLPTPEVDSPEWLVEFELATTLEAKQNIARAWWCAYEKYYEINKERFSKAENNSKLLGRVYPLLAKIAPVMNANWL